MRVSVLLLGALLVVIYTINIIAEPRHHGLHGPHKIHTFFSSSAKPYFGKSRSGRAGAKSYLTSNSKGSLAAPCLYGANSKRCRRNIPSTVNTKDSTSPRPHDESRTQAPTNNSPTNICGTNEEWAECGQGPCEQPSCLNFGKPRNCTPKGVCVAGCTCRKGYYRNNNNQCVRPNECENNVCPGMNEEITQCVSPCRETCATMGKGLVCNSTVCNEGCDCRAGYFRNSAGSCVLPNNCDCPNNQYLERCFNNCPPNTCDAIGKQFNCTTPDPNNCKPGCTCPRPMKMNDMGVCVPVSGCPPKTCQENEVYSYEQWCFKEKCGSEDILCRDPFFNIRVDKPPICTCRRPDYCRNATGTCVENTGSNRCPVPNTVYKVCKKLPSRESCESRGKIFPPVTSCTVGCECIPGTYRNRQNTCVPENECECPINEFLERCTDYRRPELCEDLYKPYNLTLLFVEATTGCRPKCVCQKGFYRNSEGRCVPIEQCPNYNCTSSEEYNNCVGNFNNCENCGDDRCRNTPLSFDIIICTPKCLCKSQQFCRNSTGVCINKEGPGGCPKQNTRYSSCGTRFTAQICESRGMTQPNPGCENGCECTPGYYRNSTLDCVVPEDCECPGKESFKCLNSCQPKTCEALLRNYDECLTTLAPFLSNPNNPRCNNTCVCPSREYKDSNGICILFSGCPCPDPNAVMVECPYRCGGGTCADPLITNNCPPRDDCDPFNTFGCQCKAGYVRRSLTDPTCIAVNQCPTTT